MNPARRDFMKMAALGTAGSMLLPGCKSSSFEATTPRIITIIGLVDIAQALADNSLVNNLYWMDSNTLRGSSHQGTDHLKTSANAGDKIQWFISGLQVETMVDIASLFGQGEQISNPVMLSSNGYNAWVGQISNITKGVYPYGAVLKVENRLMTMSSMLGLEVL